MFLVSSKVSTLVSYAVAQRWASGYRRTGLREDGGGVDLVISERIADIDEFSTWG